MSTFFNWNSIVALSVQTKQAPAGFRFCYAPDIIYPQRYQELAAAFPDVRSFELVDKMSGGGRKRFYVGPKYFSGRHHGCVCHLRHLPRVWRDFLAEAASPEVIGLLSRSSGIRFNSLCDFGLMYGDQGCMQEAHIDGSALASDPNEVRSTIAGILYFNKNPDTIGGTCVYDTDRTTILGQAPVLHNSIFYFEQHPQAWHGFPEMPAAADRRILSLSYSYEQKPIQLQTSLGHRLTCKRYIKSLLRR